MKRSQILILALICLLLPAYALAAPQAKEYGIIDYVEMKEEFPTGTTEIPITIGVLKTEIFEDADANPNIKIVIEGEYDTLLTCNIMPEEISDGMTYTIKFRRPLEAGGYFLTIGTETYGSYFKDEQVYFTVRDMSDDFVASEPEGVTNLVIPEFVENIAGGKLDISFTANLKDYYYLDIKILDSDKLFVAHPVYMEGLKTGKHDYSYSWPLTDTYAKRLADGLYYVVLSVSYGNNVIVPADERPLILCKKPEIISPAISATAALLEYAAAPVFTYKSNTVANGTGEVIDESGNVIDKFTFTALEGDNKFQWNYFTSDKKLVSAGKYSYKLTLSNPVGKVESKTYAFNVKAAPALTLTFKPGSSSVVINPWNSLPLNFSANLNTAITLSITDSAGIKLGDIYTNQRIGKGSQKVEWNLRDASYKYAKAGKYRIDITATTITGEKKTANATVQLKAPPSISISNTSISPASLTAGANAVFKGKINTDAYVSGYVMNSSNKVALTLFTNSYVKAGAFQFTVGTAALSGGSYTVMFEATNGAGSTKVSQQLTVKSPPKPVAKMKISKVESYSDGDNEVITVTFTGSGEITLTIYGPNGKAVRTASTTVTGSGTWTYKWDYRNASGVYSSAGQHKATVTGKNASGTSEAVSRYFDFN